MKIISNKRCVIGEGPVWNDKIKRLYFTNAMGSEICILNIYTGELEVRPVEEGVAAMCFDEQNRLIVSRADGVYILNDDNTTQSLYDTSLYSIQYANDMKVGPDGRIYVGTQSAKKLGISDVLDGKLYSIDKNGCVKILLDGLIVSNGLDWSADEKYLFHTDSDTKLIKEYAFDCYSGDISFTGRQVEVPGVDGFTVDVNNNIYAACWGKGHIAVIDADQLKIIDYIEVPSRIPCSCGFCGNDMEYLAIVSATYNTDIEVDKNAGFTYLHKCGAKGRKPYLFG